ncbi:beta-ketoacyl-ACP synthase [Lentilitoribacter sp. Alg239-R112]|jgi:3-oxoacyl-[acyl-carrier-protein] synthase II|uniref:beta-ketoacyl-ACP synthase n=1 Tax=Lentilitoribacter sp. Alg239-R112 TaxID=2305987 RepID=UPI0013A6A7D7|nr:beta-ketoacyl-ACP synthase [Lentilitoribacter sp. Alg239-R112]
MAHRAAQNTDVVVTGIGLVTSLGVGVKAHENILTSSTKIDPVIDTEILSPYAVHKLPEIDWTEQIPRKGDQRQMGNWQRLGVFAAGLALDDAGLKEDADAVGSMDMIVCAGGGERDVEVDSMIVEGARETNNVDELLNEKLGTEIRPTLFLAQLSNLMAGNISIVHKVTGSSRTFMGEEGSGVSAIETAHARIKHGQSTHCLVGGAFVAEREDVLFIFEAINELEKTPIRPFWQRKGEQGGIALGTAGAFLILESREHAEARGAKIYAQLDNVAGDCGPRNDKALQSRIDYLCESTQATNDTETLVISGASGAREISNQERTLLDQKFADSTVRTSSALFGHTVEAQFPLGIALAAVGLSNDEKLGKFADELDQDMQNPPQKAVVTGFGHRRSEGIATLSKA